MDIPVEGWKKFPSRNLPANLNYGHVYFYLIESIQNNHTLSNNESDSDGEDNDNVTAKPLRKGRNLLKSGFIETNAGQFCWQ